jgi:hypothetical protein
VDGPPANAQRGSSAMDATVGALLSAPSASSQPNPAQGDARTSDPPPPEGSTS